MSTGGAKVTLDVPTRIAEPLSDALFELGLVARLLPISADRWRVVVYGQDIAADSLRDVVAEQAARHGEESASLDTVGLPAIDWLAENQRSFEPLQIGRFYVHDSAHYGTVPAGCQPLLIDAATAFGTGSHQSTRMCLEVLDTIQRRGRNHWPRRVLDMGCGSGILAIAAAGALKCRVAALDIDPEAVRVARDNCQRNGVGGLVEVAHSSGRLPPAARYDLVLANILAGPLVDLAPNLSRALTGGGRLVLAGLLANQGRLVLRAYLNRGLVLENRRVLGDWLTLVLRRGRVALTAAD